MFPIAAPEPDQVAFYKGLYLGQQVAPRFRPKLPIATWRPGDAATQMTIVRDSVPVAEMFMATHEREAPMYGHQTERIIQFDVRDPSVTEAERDSVLLPLRRTIQPTTTRSAELVHKANEQRQWFPATLPAMRWIGVDADGGVWVVGVRERGTRIRGGDARAQFPDP